MTETDQPASGLMGSFRRIARSVFGLAQTRLEVFALELQEEKLRLLNLLVWFTVAVVLGVAGLTLALGIIAMFVWRFAGVGGLIGLVILTLAASLSVFWLLHRRLLHGEGPFAETRAEFKRDLETFCGE